MVGSTKGRGVRSSMKMGRLMATFDPRRLLMFAVRVLYPRVNPRLLVNRYAEVGRRTESEREDS